MDTLVKGAVVMNRSTGRLPIENVSFTEVNNLAPTLEKHRISYLRFKKSEDKKTGIVSKRENMSVQVRKLDADEFTSVSQHAFINDLIAEYQDSVVGRVADSAADWVMAYDVDAMIVDYNDTSRDSNGRKITKENIAEWFLEKCGGYVASSALAKNAQMTDETVERVVKGYAEMFGKLTAYNLTMIFTEPQFVLVKRILANVPGDDSEVRVWIDAKVAKIEAATAAESALVDAI